MLHSTFTSLSERYTNAPCCVAHHHIYMSVNRVKSLLRPPALSSSKLLSVACCSLRSEDQFSSSSRLKTTLLAAKTVKLEEATEAEKGDELVVRDDDSNGFFPLQHKESTDISQNKDIPVQLLSSSLKGELVNIRTDENSGGIVSIADKIKRLFFCSRENVIPLEHLKKRSIWAKLYSSGSPRLRGVLLLNILTFLYGSNIPVIKNAERLVDPHLFSLGRFALAALVFSPFMWQGRKDKDVINAGVELGCWISVGYLTQGVSLVTTDAGRASFISAFTVIVVPLLAGLLGIKISKLTWGAAGAALLGVGLLESTGSPATIGDFWSLISAVFFGIHMLRTEHYSRELPPDKSFSLIGTELFVITLCSMAWSWFSMIALYGPCLDLQWSGWEALLQFFIGLPWLPMVYTGLFSTAFCLWIEVSAMRDVSATDTAIIYSLEPLWGAAFAWCFLGERWGVLGWLGASLILGGSVTVQLFGGSSEAVGELSKDTLLKLRNITPSTSSGEAIEAPEEPKALQKPYKELSDEHTVVGASEDIGWRKRW